MSNKYENLEFRTISLKGSHYEVGKQLAKKLADYKRLNPRLLTKKISLKILRRSLTYMIQIVQELSMKCKDL